MLSVLIPIYNYDVSELVLDIHKQLVLSNIKFEILCRDDNSEHYISNNEITIQKLSFTQYITSDRNVGRIACRQFLADKATYDWLLFLDADVFPKTNTFIKNYLDCLSKNFEATFGGFAYSKKILNHTQNLRWRYGKKFEEVDAVKRNLKPHQLIISANFLIKKSVFKTINSQIERKSYGLDNYFSALLRINKIKVLHINNEVYHNGLENNRTYIKKSEESITTLLWMKNEKRIIQHNNKLLSLYNKFKTFKLNYILEALYLLLGNSMKNNLMSTSPNIYLLQIYKLLYISHKDLNY